MLSNASGFLSIVSLLVSIFLILLISNRSPFKFFEGIALALILGGALGNGIDRWRLGYVVDFFQLLPINFPIFNFADISINIGVLIFLLQSVRSKYHKINTDSH